MDPPPQQQVPFTPPALDPTDNNYAWDPVAVLVAAGLYPNPNAIQYNQNHPRPLADRCSPLPGALDR